MTRGTPIHRRRSLSKHGLLVTAVATAICGVGLATTPARAQYSGTNTTPNSSGTNGGTSGATAAKNAAVAAARADWDRSKEAMTAARTRVLANWKSNPQYVEANDKLDQSRKDYEAAKRAVVDRLKDDPEYKKLLDSQADAQSDLKKAQNAQSATQPSAKVQGDSVQTAAAKPAVNNETFQAATDKLNAKTQLRNLEDKAVANDPNAFKAQSKFNEAEKEAKVWKLQLDAALRSDPDFKAALDQAQQARSRMGAAAGSVPALEY